MVRLLHANSKNDAQALDEIGSLFSPLLNAWTSVRSGGTSTSLQALADVTRALKSVVPSAQRLYGANTYGRMAMGA
jgi:flagellin-specific chaperone FliS